MSWRAGPPWRSTNHNCTGSLSGLAARKLSERLSGLKRGTLTLSPCVSGSLREPDQSAVHNAARLSSEALS